jgi:hypothetical protein
VFEAVVRACMDSGLVKGEGFAVDASVMEASIQTCGHQVTETVTIPLIAVVENLNVPLSAMACFP